MLFLSAIIIQDNAIITDYCQNTTKLHVSVHAIFDTIIIQNNAIMIDNCQNSTQKQLIGILICNVIFE